MPRPDYIPRITLNTADSIYSVQMMPDYDATGSLLHEGVVVNTGYCPSRVQPASEILGNQAVVGYSYDPLGRLSAKQLNSGNVIGYRYNMRGQLTNLSHPVFSQTLFYENGPDPCYNGNISAIRLQYGDGPAIDRAYSYDNLNRLTSLTSSDGYNTAYTYNLNSSPLTIQRYGMLSDRSIGLVDDLELSYSGNRPVSVSDYAQPVILESSLDFDAGDDGEALYGYDADGRLISDTGRGITSISYTPGNLPVRTAVKGGTFDCSYSADGRKLKTVTDYLANVAVAGGGTSRPGFGVPKDSITDPGVIGGKFPITKSTPEERYYIGPFELVKPSQSSFVLFNTQPGLARINMSWGYFDSEGNSNEYVPDYQGNIRAVTRGNEVVQMTDYYPYGLPMANSTGAAANRYKYTGKEFETRAGLNTYDFQARQYTPQFPLLSTTDSRAGDNPEMNTYLYCVANPILFIDPTGNSPIYSTEGEFLGTDDNGFEGEPIIMEKSDFDCKKFMSPQIAKSLAVSPEKVSEKAKALIATHYSKLPERPDYDGYLTFWEARDWYRNGNGEPLYVDLNKLDLSGFVPPDDEYIGNEYYYNFFFNCKNLNQKLVYGNVKLHIYADDCVRAFADKYDFDMKSWTGLKNIVRNIFTIRAAMVHGDGKPYTIFIYGTAKLQNTRK